MIRIIFLAPHLLEAVLLPSFFHNNPERLLLFWQTLGFMECAVLLFGMNRGFPVTVDAAETPRPGDFAGTGINHFEQIFATHRIVNRLLKVSRKRQRLQHDLIEAEYLRFAVSSMELFYAPRLWRGQCAYGKLCEKEADGLPPYIFLECPS